MGGRDSAAFGYFRELCVQVLGAYKERILTAVLNQYCMHAAAAATDLCDMIPFPMALVRSRLNEKIQQLRERKHVSRILRREFAP